MCIVLRVHVPAGNNKGSKKSCRATFSSCVVLRHLFRVLHNTEQHSSFNQMMAYNLSRCLAPSLLGPPNATSSQLEEDFTKKFLLENHLQLRGEDTPSSGKRAATPDEGHFCTCSQWAARLGLTHVSVGWCWLQVDPHLFSKRARPSSYGGGRAPNSKTLFKSPCRGGLHKGPQG
ncbi:Rho GTPase-activating protein 20 [Camelus dromedarius]|uniref:Rho GTPase-activating protein 20 n=1 Tax=Camelus dromedarius TaxID=9838 RepID=A0A5N4ECV1_CAMDR|nr:Rho GTPase-activating protein 20 [Camelus dromedarius]